MTAQTDYQIIRNSIAVHTLGAPLVRLTVGVPRRLPVEVQ